MAVQNFDLEFIDVMGIDALFQAADAIGNKYQEDSDRAAYLAELNKEVAEVKAILAEIDA